MPYHKVPRARLHEDIRDIEREGEIVVQVLNRPHDAEFVDVFTRWVGHTPMSVELTTREHRYAGGGPK